MPSTGQQDATHIAFGVAYLEVTEKPVFGLIEKTVKDKKEVFKVVTTYGKVSKNTAITKEQIIEEKSLRLSYPNSFILETNNKDHLLEFLDEDFDTEKFEHIKNSFKSSIAGAVKDFRGNLECGQ